MINKLLCFLGFHKWKNIDENPLPRLEPGEFMLLSNLHECERCGKQEYKGMGWLL